MEKKIYKEVNKNETETTINVLYKEEKFVYILIKLICKNN